ncbi:MAG: DUF1538 domain-containing protein [Gammaproteobacteria bacterium]|nr:DUF1538 domain-containing protein [Gammaproteobacteria bacterium]MBT7370086.1 DUF1538 domain-containing protein [Gammaproteobacteria bacterium]
MSQEISFSQFTRELNVHLDSVSYNELVPPVEYDENGDELETRKETIRVGSGEIYRLLQPYLSVRLNEQIRAVLPLAVYLVIFQLFILRENIVDATIITGGLLAVIFGLMLFMEGLKVGLMPFGESLGISLPAKAGLAVVLAVAFLLGIGVTFAEPAIGALQTAGSLVDVAKAPYLYTILNDWAGILVLAVGAGVGLAAALGTIRFIYGWSLKPLIYITLVPVLGLTLFMATDAEMMKVLGLAFDCGAVTTGPVTVPLVLSLGIGIANAAGKGGDSLSGFGIVTLASLFPIIAVMILALYISSQYTPEMIIESASAVQTTVAGTQWFETTPGVEIIGGIRAIVPLVIFLLLVMTVLLREKIPTPKMIFFGIFLCVLGMIVFSLGLSYGLSKLGSQSGGLVPAAFTHINAVEDSPLYMLWLGLFIALAFAWLLGFGATLAEPALNALGMTVENLTNGSFKKQTLMYAVSFGVAFGISIGVAKIIFDIPIAYLLVPGYIIAIILTVFSNEEFVNIAWDSAGVTTGPVTVPLVLAMGLGFGNALGAIEGFGILSMASIGPIVCVLSTGLYIRWKINRRHASAKLEPEQYEGSPLV